MAPAYEYPYKSFMENVTVVFKELSKTNYSDPLELLAGNSFE
jgi:hypothetical protein